jgi:hypothetical protein
LRRGGQCRLAPFGQEAAYLKLRTQLPPGEGPCPGRFGSDLVPAARPSLLAAGARVQFQTQVRSQVAVDPNNLDAVERELHRPDRVARITRDSRKADRRSAAERISCRRAMSRSVFPRLTCSCGGGRDPTRRVPSARPSRSKLRASQYLKRRGAVVGHPPLTLTALTAVVLFSFGAY